MRKFIFCLSLVFFTLLADGTAFCQDDSGAFLKGFVKTSQGEPIAAEIIIGNRSKILKTDDGVYRLTEIDFHHNGEISFLLTEKNKYLPNLFRANIGQGFDTTCNIITYDYYALIKITEIAKNDSIKEPILELATLPNAHVGVELEIRGIQNQFQKRTFASSNPSNKVVLFLHPGTYEIKPISRPYIKSFTVEILPNSKTSCKFYLGKL